MANLKRVVKKAPLVVLQFERDEWSDLVESRYGASEFSIARPHSLLQRYRLPTACLVFGQDDSQSYALFGIVGSRTSVSTLDSRIKIRLAELIEPNSMDGLLRIDLNSRFKTMLHTRMTSGRPVVALSPKLSSHLVEALSRIETNRTAMRTVSYELSSTSFSSTASLQEDAVQTALRVFGISKHDRTVDVELFNGRESALARRYIMEDSAIEHDARSVPGYHLIDSDITGRARFRKGPEVLEVYTANRRHLERVFGVDLIYLNLTRGNIVMVQYKMLERTSVKERKSDWIYRPDSNFRTQMNKMQIFDTGYPLEDFEYRLNPQIFYLKFVKRNARLGSPTIIIPIDHYKRLCSNPASFGPRGGFRISFDSLDGRYLRQDAFLSLIRSGYIGSTSTTTDHLVALIRAAMQSDRAVVAAIQSSLDESVAID